MSHFAPGPRLAFSVKVKMHVRHSQGGGPVRLPILPHLPEHIGHGSGTERIGRTEGETADGSHMLLELTRYAAFNGPVAGIMRPGREFIHEHPPAFIDEHFHSQ